MEFECPICKRDFDAVDRQYRIQDSDDLNGDDKSTDTTLVELWYCVWCGQYFRAYYTLDRIVGLKEEEAAP